MFLPSGSAESCKTRQDKTSIRFCSDRCKSDAKRARKQLGCSGEEEGSLVAGRQAAA
jgi:hypothetical protein